ncbi:MAG: GGDEF domain-containing protein [Firmicutes bacterium]|nr:GGDEF domain-containing protein [Bacillota bacterium]
MAQIRETIGMNISDIDQEIGPLEGRVHRDKASEPRLYISFGRGIMRFPLGGHQSLGRMNVDNNPDIAIDNSFVSRDHGFFDSEDGSVRYTAVKTKNGICLNDRLLEPGETVELKDGDELTIPAREGNADISIMLLCAFTQSRIEAWEMLRLSSRDRLTGLSDRGMFSSWYLQHCHTERWSGGCVFLLDIDDFKSINDTCGHTAGDKALQRVGQGLMQVLDHSECVCRWGGDEFAGLIPLPPEEAGRKLDDFREKLEGEKLSSQVRMTVSIGFIAMEDLENPENLEAAVEKADQALYMAKLDGKNRVFRFRKNLSGDREHGTETRVWGSLYVK